MWKVHETNKFKRGFKKLGGDAQTRCRNAVSILASSDDPRSIAYERLRRTQEYVYRFGSYRLVYAVYADTIKILELRGVGHGHSAYR